MAEPEQFLNLPLYQRLGQDEISQIRELIKSNPKKTLNRNELRDVLKEFGITYSDEAMKILFWKMDIIRDDHCNFDELVTHLIYEFQCDDPNEQKQSLSLPIVDKPVLRDSQHRFLIIRIRLNPVVLPDRSLNYTTASYVTCSKDGTINFWTQNFELQKTEVSKNPALKVAKTWILELICMPDVSIICTSSIEGDIRFYDIAGNNFIMKIIVTDLNWSISSMSYWFGKKTSIDSKLILGDFGGNVILVEFNPESRGPFRSKSGVTVGRTTWKNFRAGIIPEFRIIEFLNKHKDIVRQVDYCEELNCIVSAAECREIPPGQFAGPGLVLTDLGVQRKETIMRMTRGVTCFAYESSYELFATGGPDCVLRLWRPNLPNKATAILHGHNFGITHVFFQDSERIYSIDSGKVVKVWSMSEKVLQTYILVSTKLTDPKPAVHLYNDNTRELLFANMKIAIVKCSPRLKLKKTDGSTHSLAVSVLLYNTLLKNIISCGFDSCIIVWEPWTGKRERLIRSAHTTMFYGEILNVEITAGCLDAGQLYLITGARNGTLKIWCLKDGICMRNLSIEYMCEVTAVFWLPYRILAVGWNKHVVEFPDQTENDVSGESDWITCHYDDIFTAAIRPPDVIVTGSYIGGIVFWNLRTGQPYRKLEVTNPRTPIKIIAKSKEKKNKSQQKFANPRNSDTSGAFLQRRPSRNASPVFGSDLERRKALRSRRISVVQMPQKLQMFRALTVHCMIFLTTRPSLQNVGNLFVGVDNGQIQVFSDHITGGFIDSYNAIHMAGDCVISMTTDRENRYLMTGTAMGYIKIWLVCNYCLPKANQIHINMPKLRLEFPFLIKSSWQGRAKRTVRDQKNPMLVNSFRAHKNMSITDLKYINDCKLLVSSSTDKSVRIWTLSGRYIGTLGSPITWNTLSSTEMPPQTFEFRIPPDIKRIASSTTLQVLNGGAGIDNLQERVATRRLITKRIREEQEKHGADASKKRNSNIYGAPIEPYDSPDLQWPAPNIEKSTVLDINQPYLPPLNYQLDELISNPTVPKVLQTWKQFDFLENTDQ